MVLKTKKHQPNELSILVLRDGFSFCTQKKSCFYPTEDSNNIDPKAISDFLVQQELVSETVSLIHLDGLSSIVPLELFEKENAAFYLSKGLTLAPNQQVVFDVLESYNQAVVYPRDVKKWNVLKELFPTLEAKHATTTVLAPLTDFSMGTPKKQLFVHLREGAFELFLFQGAQLLFFNSFEQQHVDEFLYYLFYITEQFYLKPEGFKLAFLGAYDHYKEYYEGVQEYHSDVIFLDAPSENRQTKHPVPFLENKTL
tara:strand:- start:561 stop:1325 length:765 start_codon:yes stop_codon:yes gene_type:complete